MASSVVIQGKTFERFLSEGEIQARLQEVAVQIRAMHQEEDVVFIVILKGSLFVAADLMRACQLDTPLEVVRARSYQGMKSTGVVEITMTDTLSLKGKTVIIIEDIVETGRTLQAVHHHLKQFEPGHLKTFSLLRKPKALINPVPIDYVGFDIDSEFVVGYGLDFDEKGRELKDIYRLRE